MAEDKKLVEAITSMDVDFAQWYTDVCKKAELMSYSSVKGCMIFKPAGYAIWENIKNEMDRRFKETGVENVYLPMFIPESMGDRLGISPFTMLVIIFTGLLVYGVAGFITGPVSYVIIKALVIRLRCEMGIE